MSRFETISTDVWSRAPFSRLSKDGKLVNLWAKGNPSCGMAGLYRFHVEQIALDTGATAEEVSAALAELERHGMVCCDGDLLWVCDRVEALRSRNPGIAKAIARDVAELEPAHSFRRAFLDRYAGVPWLRDVLRPLVAETVGEPSPNGSGTVSGFPVVEGNSDTVPGPSQDGPMQLHMHGLSRTTANAGRARTREADEDAVWAHYLAKFHGDENAGPRPTFDETRRSIVREALAVRDVERCKLAIDGLACSPHHNGQNDHGIAYTDIRYALRGKQQDGESTEERIDRMAALATTPLRANRWRINLTSADILAAERSENERGA